MLKRFAMLAAVLALCCGAFAQEEGGGEGEKPKKKARAARKPTYKSILKGDPLVARLGLTEEQVKKVEELEAETKAAFDKMVEEAGEDRKKLRGVTLKLPELYDGLRAKIVELLNDDQKKKYEAGVAVLAEFKTKKEAIMAEMKAAGKDRDKRKEAQKKLRGLGAELEKVLDEKVGPRAGKPAGAPKKKKAKAPDEGGGGDDAANAEF
ncbi:MAG: hypothetical protein ACYTGB_02875 [Planctomycetota bacterium]|jgi:hypothetical protein